MNRVSGRVTYNFNQYIAAEAEINFFPQKQLILTADGNAIQAQFEGEIRFPGVTPPFIIQRGQTVHNLQLSSGIGFRF